MSNELDMHYKLYVPVEYLDGDELVNVPIAVYEEVEKKLDNIAETYGGMTRYLAVGKYFNKEQQKVYDIATIVIDIFISKDVEAQFEAIAMDFISYIKDELHQESVAYEKSSTDRMYLI